MEAERNPNLKRLLRPTDKDRNLVESAAAFGITQDRIAKHLKIDIKTLHKHFREELDRGSFQADMEVSNSMHELTKHPDARIRLEACKYWTARRCGWTETQAHKVGGDGAPVQLLIAGPDKDVL